MAWRESCAASCKVDVCTWPAIVTIARPMKADSAMAASFAEIPVLLWIWAVIYFSVVAPDNDTFPVAWQVSWLTVTGLYCARLPGPSSSGFSSAANRLQLRGQLRTGSADRTGFPIMPLPSRLGAPSPQALAPCFECRQASDPAGDVKCRLPSLLAAEAPLAEIGLCRSRDERNRDRGGSIAQRCRVAAAAAGPATAAATALDGIRGQN